MKKLFILSIFLFSGAIFAQSMTDATGTVVDISDSSRLISLGGDITEIIYALGIEDTLVAVDSSSIYPAATDELPEVGYVRRLAAEGVLSLEPSLIVTSEDAGPPEVLQQIREAGVPIFVVPTEDSIAGVKQKINVLGEIFGVSARATSLNLQIDLDVAEAQLYVDAAQGRAKPRVMFIYARGAGTVSVSGTGTSADAMIALAAGDNAVTAYESYKPLTAEAAVSIAPDVLLFLSRGLDSVGGIEGLADLPGLSLTPAYENGRVIALDDLYLLGFGPRVGRAIRDLTLAFYPTEGN